jgi:hypothetical protein
MADNVGVTGAVVAGWGGGGGGGGTSYGGVEVPEGSLLLAHSSNLVDELIKEDTVSLALLHRCFDGSNFL